MDIKVYMALIEHKHGADGICAGDERSRESEIESYARYNWKSGWGEEPQGREDVIDAYFKNVLSDEDSVYETLHRMYRLVTLSKTEILERLAMSVEGETVTEYNAVFSEISGGESETFVVKAFDEESLNQKMYNHIKKIWETEKVFRNWTGAILEDHAAMIEMFELFISGQDEMGAAEELGYILHLDRYSRTVSKGGVIRELVSLFSQTQEVVDA